MKTLPSNINLTDNLAPPSCSERSDRPDVVPRLEHGQQSHVVREPAAGKVSVDKTETSALTDERLRETGGGRDGAHRISNTRGRHVEIHVIKVRQETDCQLIRWRSEAETDWKMQPMIIIFPSRGSMGSRARIRPRGVSSSLVSRASSSERCKVQCCYIIDIL